MQISSEINTTPKQLLHINSENSHKGLVLNYEVLAKLITLKLTSTRSNQTSEILWALQKEGVSLIQLSNAIFSPKIVIKKEELQSFVTPLMIKKNWVHPVLKALRGNKKLTEIADLLGQQNISTYHHWETGRSDIPFPVFLKILDIQANRLLSFIESLPFEVLMSEAGFNQNIPDFYKNFFNEPWTPTVLLCTRLPQLESLNSVEQQIEFLNKNLKITKEKIEQSINTLFKLDLIKLKNSKLISNPCQFYAIPGIPSSKIDEIHNFWFSKSLEMLTKKGFHKVEQHALSRESKDKIIIWISELREKIKEEVQNTKSTEMLIHINWQLIELIS